MTTITDLQKLKMDAITSEPLKHAVQQLLDDYKKEPDKAFFEKTAKDNISKLFSLVTSNSPQAIPVKKVERSDKQPKQNRQSSPATDLRTLTTKTLEQLTDLGSKLEEADQKIIATTKTSLKKALDNQSLKINIKKAIEQYKNTESTITDTTLKKQISKTINELAKAVGIVSSKSKPKKPQPDKATSKKTLEELKKLSPKLEACRAVIREHNRKKREAMGTKPKKTRYTKLKEKLLTLVSLIPDNLKDDASVQQKTETILLNTHTRLVEAWGMSKLKAKHGAEAIKDKFEAMEATTEKRNIPKDKKENHSLKVDIVYRDATNFKTSFTHEIDIKAFPKAKNLKTGDEIEMGQYGTLSKKEFFNSEIHPHHYIEEYDHNLLEIISITKR